MIANDHQETDSINNSKLMGQFSERLKNWWESILESPGAFEKPEFLIGLYTISPVLTIGTVERSGSHIIISNFDVTGFKFIGDFIICRVKVVQSGTYSVTARFGWTGQSGAVVSIKVGPYGNLWDGSATTLSTTIDTSGPLKFGEMFLSKTSEGVQDEMMITLESTDEDGSDVFDYFTSVEFALASE
eukprot:TRINITY_DN8350_c0_g1_i6.p2 TRINITY_DN8350_c0_g1~~TRINITY_DN8350_c0_g1_i6.p2  ORF type:complete len:187 (-),score=24.16 TRINITY_DN8350_c0_g1_i6:583-1143(-)